MVKKKTDRKKIVNKLDKTVSLIVRNRDKKCVVCGSTFMLQCGHLFSRVNYSTRWDLLNCHAQCAACNFKHEHDPWPFYSWFIKQFGQESFDNLYALHKHVAKISTADLEKMVDELDDYLKRQLKSIYE